MPEHYEGRPMGTATKTTRPLILPAKTVQLLRGERGYTENSRDIAELAISFYQDGKPSWQTPPTRPRTSAKKYLATAGCCLLPISGR